MLRAQRSDALSNATKVVSSRGVDVCVTVGVRESKISALVFSR